MIDSRARQMWEGGLTAEVRGLLQAGYSPDLRPLQAIGYRQVLAVLGGRLDEATALAEMQRATRNYAKRQVTWFRREPAAEWVTVSGEEWAEPLAKAILDRLEGSKGLGSAKGQAGRPASRRGES